MRATVSLMALVLAVALTACADAAPSEELVPMIESSEMAQARMSSFQAALVRRTVSERHLMVCGEEDCEGFSPHRNAFTLRFYRASADDFSSAAEDDAVSAEAIDVSPSESLGAGLFRVQLTPIADQGDGTALGSASVSDRLGSRVLFEVTYLWNERLDAWQVEKLASRTGTDE